MVTRRLIQVMAAALLFSSVVTFALSRHLAHSRATSPMVRLVVAARDVPAGETLEPGMYKLVDWPASPAVRGAFNQPDALRKRTSLIPLAAGDLILEQQLTPAGSANGLAREIPTGLRAIALKSDEVAGVAGFLLPGSAVDVLVTSSNFSNASTSTVAQDVPVLAAGQKTQPDPDGKPVTTTVVTLLVSPVDAEKLALASASGKIHFVLRNGEDRLQLANLAPQTSAPNLSPQRSAAAPATIARTVEPSTRPAAKAAKAKANDDTVEVVTGGRSSELSLPGSRP